MEFMDIDGDGDGDGDCLPEPDDTEDPHAGHDLQESSTLLKTEHEMTNSVHNGPDFRRLSIVPSKEELLGKADLQLDIPKNKVNGEKYDNISEYLATHFLLLREDCMQDLREGVQKLNMHSPDFQNIQIYEDVRLLSIHCGKYCIEYKVSFRWNSLNYRDVYSSAKCLVQGSLLCISSDNFETIFWAKTLGHKKSSSDESTVFLHSVDGLPEPSFDYGKQYTMIESPAFFEAYCHVLQNLQKFDMMDLPFQEHLLFLQQEVDVPEYLHRGSEYDFSCAFPEIHNRDSSSTFSVLEEWPQLPSSLDPSQIEAIRYGLTKKLAVIQGPPGTGKTYVGKLIVKILLNNLWRSREKESDLFWEKQDFLEPDTFPHRSEDIEIRESKRMKFEKEAMEGPLLILCFTNHALDQFLEGVFDFEKSLIRYGGRSTSLKLKDCSVKVWVKKQRRGLLSPIWDSHRAIVNKSDKLRMEISKCFALTHLQYVTFEPLKDVATEDQVRSLFFSGRDPKIVHLWLQGLDQQAAKAVLQGSDRSMGSSETIPTMTCEDKAEDMQRLQELNLEEPYVWALETPARRMLHSEWLKGIKAAAEKRLSILLEHYKSMCKTKEEINSRILLEILRGAKVIGMTTTAAARCHDILMKLKPKVVIVEEAAEILEAHIVACLTPSTQHLILIGDHMQLRPSVAVNKLAISHHHDVSLFERLVMGGVELASLKYQRRMRPSISRLLRSFYPALKDHDSVYGRKNVEGMWDNVFFLDHKSEERNASDSKSKVNIGECVFVAELYLYILKQGTFQPSDITILTMYRAQVQCIKNVMQEKLQQLHHLSRDLSTHLQEMNSQITCVDDYQGEESDIIILSLVRNISPAREMGSIGFLDNENRVCVALSRARKGLYIFGNAELLCQKSKLWERILADLRESNAVGSHITLLCQNHLFCKTEIGNVKDFQLVTDGGCYRRCKQKLKCLHSCPRFCHPGGHGKVVCTANCNKRLRCQHICLQKCHGRRACPPCTASVQVWLPCGHRLSTTCSMQTGLRCQENCQVILSCGHTCANNCGQDCTQKCNKMVVKKLPCGHTGNLACYQPPSEYRCHKLCGKSLKPGCDHFCEGMCSVCKRNNKHPNCCKQCEKLLPCGHQCKSLCYKACQPCLEPCENACYHRQCHKRCGELCQPCEEPCSWICEHYQCTLKCDEVCQRPRCNEKCSLLLKCGHRCIGHCGEPCPTRCANCQPHTTEAYTNSTLEELDSSACFVQLADCGHIFLSLFLDAIVDNLAMVNYKDVTSSKWPILCPKCKTPIRKTLRYKSVINDILMKLNEAKKEKIENDFWFQSNPD